jgi:hypothetical protein
MLLSLDSCLDLNEQSEFSKEATNQTARLLGGRLILEVAQLTYQRNLCGRGPAITGGSSTRQRPLNVDVGQTGAMPSRLG